VHSHTFVIHLYIDLTSWLCRLMELCKIAFFLFGETGGVTKPGVGDVTAPALIRGAMSLAGM
jgi:hypothetical protein